MAERRAPSRPIARERWRQQAFEARWNQAALLILGVLGVPWFLRLLEHDFPRIALLVGGFCLATLGISAVTDRARSRGLLLVSSLALQALGVALVGAVWLETAETQETLLLALFGLPAVVAASRADAARRLSAFLSLGALWGLGWATSAALRLQLLAAGLPPGWWTDRIPLIRSGELELGTMLVASGWIVVVASVARPPRRPGGVDVEDSLALRVSSATVAIVDLSDGRLLDASRGFLEAFERRWSELEELDFVEAIRSSDRETIRDVLLGEKGTAEIAIEDGAGRRVWAGRIDVERGADDRIAVVTMHPTPPAGPPADRPGAGSD